MKKNTFFDLLLFCFFSVGFAYVILAFLEALINFGGDARLRFLESILTIKGFNPISVARGDIILFDNDLFDLALGNFPWVYTINILFLPFVNFNWDEINIFIGLFYFLISILTSYTFYKYLVNNKIFKDIKKRFLLNFLILIIPVGNYFFLSGMANGNHSVLVSSFILILLIVSEKENLKSYIFSSLLITFTLLKPQISIPFLTVFFIHQLINKRTKFLIITSTASFSLFLIFTTITAFLLKESAFYLVIEMFNRGSNYLNDGFSNLNYGIFDFLIYFDFDTTSILIIQATLFLPLFVVIGIQKFSLLNKFSLVSLLIILWTYNHNFDYQLSGLATLSILVILSNKEKIFKKYNKSFLFNLVLIFFMGFNLFPHLQRLNNFLPIVLPLVQRLIFTIEFLFLFFVLSRMNFENKTNL
jgi:hypothetical protein